MQLKVYAWEQHQRWKIWLIWMLTFIIIFIIFLFFHLDFLWIIIFLISIWWYLYVYLKSQKIIDLIILDEWIKIWDNFVSWNSLSWFVLELDKTTNQIKNIVFVRNNWNYEIYTINDSLENLEKFYNTLIQYIPILDWYDMNFIDRLIRILKL